MGDADNYAMLNSCLKECSSLMSVSDGAYGIAYSVIHRPSGEKITSTFRPSADLPVDFTLFRLLSESGVSEKSILFFRI